MREHAAYFHGLRAIKTALRKAEKDGLIEETTHEGTCRPENFSHVHTWQAHIPLKVTIVDIEGRESVTTKSDKLQLGHPCGIIAVYGHNARNKVPEYIEEVRIEPQAPFSQG